MSCASPLAGTGPAPEGDRKTVTVVFCDVVGSTSLGEELDPETTRQLIARFFRRMRNELERHGGKVEKFIGDAVMAVFGVPRLHEDDALRAVRAADAMAKALSELNLELRERFGTEIRVRIGVNTGVVVVGDPGAGQSLVVGDAVNVAARLERAAEPGQILLGPTTYALVRDHVVATPTDPMELKGRRSPVVAYRLGSVEPGPDAIGARPDPPLVGRERELTALRSAFDRAIATRECVLVTVVGPAGVGKSRLAREFASSFEGDALVLRARCLPYGEGITFWPVAELVKRACGITDDERRDVAQAKLSAALDGADDAEIIVRGLAEVTGIGTADAGPQETFWAIRRFLAWLARDRPVVAIVDDVQWAEQTFLDLVEYVVGWTRDTPVLLVCLARPDLLESRPSWGGVSQAPTLMLEPLGDEDTVRFVEGLLGPGAAELEGSALARISDAAGGNPLFLEEMLRMLEDDGVLRREGARWVVEGDLATVRVPDTIHALLSARLDRLSDEERVVIRCASVIGKVFWWGAVAEIAPDHVRSRVGGYLQSLVRKDLVRPDRSNFSGEDAFRFHHILIQETAYRATPKEQRAELHERFATWVTRVTRDRANELDEVIGYHLEQSARYRAELGAPRQTVEELAVRAARPLTAAGLRAMDRRDVSAAAELLRRGAALFPRDHPERRPALLAFGEALSELGDLSAAEAVMNEAEELGRAAGDEKTAANAAIQRLLLLESTDPKMLAGELSEAERLISTLEGLGDDLGVARAWLLVADLNWAHARYAAVDDALSRAIEHARKAGARREEADALGRYTGSGAYGPAPGDEIERRCNEVLEGWSGTGYEAPALRALAVARAMHGRFDEARELARRARTLHDELGLQLRAMFVSETLGSIELLAGDPVAAERELRSGLDQAAEMGEQGFASTVAAMLAHALVDQRRFGDAEDAASLSEKTGAEDDVSTQVMWRSALARVLSARGRPDEARALAETAVRLAEQTDDLNMRGDTLIALGEVHGTANESEDAASAFAKALERYEAKGNEVAADSTRRRLAALA
jgi:class 3 adenylate cyclase/tetratricopeptide (TPR) repeat protein